ncbi:hypothetical protein [Brenneria tiliae]|uniref:Phage protein n=1 Tax=Brenneria tiliae TaxID=2914984 RepID=A0ABT0MRP2_9GAMM|nr:hypothetical protein [Brenneria tiliae]MCL2892510.1 hypothetical protein [Brenneria tiliae]
MFDFTDLPDGVNKLYAAPVLPSQPQAVPDDLLTAVEEVIRISDRKHEAWDRAKAAISSYRAAMLQPATSGLSAMTSEHRRVIEMLLKVCGCAFELMDDGCQMEVDGEPSVVVPFEVAHALSDALDEIENSLSTEDDDRPDVFLAWSAMPRAALKSLLQPPLNDAHGEPSGNPGELNNG